MKKKLFAALSLVLPLSILCACGGTPTEAFSANWYQNTTSDVISGKKETLTYAVTFEPAESEVLTFAYDTGTYTTELIALTETLPGTDEREAMYFYTAKLSISGTISLKGAEGEKKFTDSVESTVLFRSVAKGLQPIRSTKHVKSTSPSGRTSELSAAYLEYDYTYNVEYTYPLDKAKVAYKQTATDTVKDEAEWTKTVDLGNGINFFDNEQLEFILRGLDMSSAVSLKTINPLTTQVVPVSMGEAPADVLESCTLNGEKRDIAAKSFSFGYQTETGGQSVTLVYAKKTDGMNNRYRNVLLRRRVPILQNLGTLVYTLTDAQFID